MKTNLLLIPLMILTITLLLFTSFKNDNPDHFEGKVFYKNEYILKTDKVDSNYLNEVFGKTALLYFKEGNFCEVYDGGYMLEQLYLKTENKTYLRKDNSDTLYWFECGKPAQKMLSYKINPKKEKILGIECDELITYYENKTISYYYNDSFKIDPDWYKNYTLSNKNINTKRMKAIYLKYKIEYVDFISTVTATKIEKAKLNNKLFEIPKNKILKEDK